MFFFHFEEYVCNNNLIERQKFQLFSSRKWGEFFQSPFWGSCDSKIQCEDPTKKRPKTRVRPDWPPILVQPFGREMGPRLFQGNLWKSRLVKYDHLARCVLSEGQKDGGVVNLKETHVFKVDHFVWHM